MSAKFINKIYYRPGLQGGRERDLNLFTWLLSTSPPTISLRLFSRSVVPLLTRSNMASAVPICAVTHEHHPSWHQEISESKLQIGKFAPQRHAFRITIILSLGAANLTLKVSLLYDVVMNFFLKGVEGESRVVLTAGAASKAPSAVESCTCCKPFSFINFCPNCIPNPFINFILLC